MFCLGLFRETLRVTPESVQRKLFKSQLWRHRKVALIIRVIPVFAKYDVSCQSVSSIFKNVTHNFADQFPTRLVSLHNKLFIDKISFMDL